MSGNMENELISSPRQMRAPRLTLELVAAAESDARRILAWRNDAVSRRNSLDTRKVGLRTHLRWFRAKLADPACRILVARARGGKPVGQLRLDAVADGTAEVSIVVDPACRGRGVGTAMLRSIPDGGRRLRRLVAYVRPDNASSAVAFLKAGFRFSALVRRRGVAAYRLHKRLR